MSCENQINRKREIERERGREREREKERKKCWNIVIFTNNCVKFNESHKLFGNYLFM